MTTAKSALVFLVAVMVKVLARSAHQPHVPHRRVAGLLRLGQQVTDGLMAVVTRGARATGSVIGLSLVVRALTPPTPR